MAPTVYIIQSIQDGRFYIGSTTALKARLRHHAGGFTPSTKRFGETRLVFSQRFETLTEARYIERRLKKMKRRDYLERIIMDGYIKMKRPTRSTAVGPTRGGRPPDPGFAGRRDSVG